MFKPVSRRPIRRSSVLLRIEPLEPRAMLSLDGYLDCVPPSSSDELSGLASLSSMPPAALVEQVASPDAGDPLNPDGDVLATHFDKIPNFAQHYTAVSVASGRWSDPAVWMSGVVPTDADVVRIAAGTDVLYDLASDAALEAVGVVGTLRFATDANTRMRVSNLIVYEEGYLEIGSEAAPVEPSVSAEIVLRDQPLQTGTPEAPGIDPRQFGQGLFVFGKIRVHGAAQARTFVRLTGDAHAGDSVLELVGEPVGWRVGDRLFLPDTRHIDPAHPSYSPQWEEVQIADIQGTTLTLAAPLAFGHRGARDADGTPTVLDDGTPLTAHLANLTRNVVIRSENPDGVRGHTMFLDRADVDVRYAAFQDLGRTKAAKLDSATFDAEGHLTHVGENQIGRYSIHAHHLYGPENPDNVGYQFQFIGNAIVGGLKWGLALHDSSFGLVQENVVYNIDGAGIVTEDGSETGNVFAANFVARINGGTNASGVSFKQGASNLKDLGELGDAFWFAGPMNVVRDNVVADAIRTGFVLFPGNITGLPKTSGRTVAVPNFPGAATHDSADTHIVEVSFESFDEFARNETYGATTAAITLWETGNRDANRPFLAGSNYAGGEENVLVDTRVWHLAGRGISMYYAVSFLIDGWLQRGDINVVTGTRDKAVLGSAFASAITHAGNKAQHVVIRRADIQGMQVGLVNRGRGNAGLLVVEDSYFENYVNISVRPWTQSALRETILRNVRFGPRSKTNIEMLWKPPEARNVLRPDVVAVFDYNGVPGQNFQVYYSEQAPDTVLPRPITPSSNPKSPSYYLFDCAADGLSNAQCWEQYGAAVSGQVAPCDAVGSVSCSEAAELASQLKMVGLAFPIEQNPVLPRPKLIITVPAANALVDRSAVRVQFVLLGDLERVADVRLEVDSQTGSDKYEHYYYHSFSGLTLGDHVARGWLVDAEGQPIAGTDFTTAFTVGERVGLAMLAQLQREINRPSGVAGDTFEPDDWNEDGRIDRVDLASVLEVYGAVVPPTPPPTSEPLPSAAALAVTLDPPWPDNEPATAIVEETVASVSQTVAISSGQISEATLNSIAPASGATIRRPSRSRYYATPELSAPAVDSILAAD